MPIEAVHLDLEGSTRDAPSGASWVGPVDPDETVELTAYLRRRPFRTPIVSHPGFGTTHPADRRYIPHEEFAESFGGDPDDAAAIRNVVSQWGVHVVETDLARRSLRLSGSLSSICDLLGSEVGRYRGPAGLFRARTGPLRLPAGLEQRIVGIFGLDVRPQLQTHFRVAAAPSVSYSPLMVGTAYAFPSADSGSGQCVGILEFGGGYRAEDLQKFFSSMGESLPAITAVSIDGATNAPTGNPGGPDAEVELDIEIVGALVPGARIVAYFAPNSEQGFVDAMSTAIHDAVNRPNLLSVSWGGPEPSWTRQAMTVFSQACEDATAMGVTILAASGDRGATDGEPGGMLAVDFPSSSPYVLGCGGTRLLLPGGGRLEERVWNDLAQGGGATGGGVSEFFPLPSYQADAQVPAGEGGFAGRGVPDVAADADPDTGYAVFVDGSSAVIGGTSAVAPLWAALLARINQGLGAPVGYLQPLLYGPPEKGTFHAVLEGNNGGYDAGPGWDACTGLGTPDGAALLAALQKK